MTKTVIVLDWMGWNSEPDAERGNFRIPFGYSWLASFRLIVHYATDRFVDHYYWTTYIYRTNWTKQPRKHPKVIIVNFENAFIHWSAFFFVGIFMYSFCLWLSTLWQLNDKKVTERSLLRIIINNKWTEFQHSFSNVQAVSENGERNIHSKSLEKMKSLN